MSRFGLAVLVALVLCACSLSSALRPGTYTVKRGDTLFSIARRYDMAWRDLARINRIRPPYVIEVGQRLQLDRYPPLDYSQAGESAGTPRVARAPQDSSAEQEAAIQASTPQLTRTIERGGRSRPTPETPPTTTPAPDTDADNAGAAAEESQINEASEQAPVAPTRTGGPSEDGWQWPASGSILRAYGANRTRKGIDIGGRVGSPVYAASSGRVVYNGTGLKGYGKLIIIQHDEHFLSAYGFTQNIRVRQGQDIAAGTHIANMGLGPQRKPTLHFEIRRDGKPINPASVLPEQ